MHAPLRPRVLRLRSFEGVHIALFSASGSISKQFGPIASEAGATVSGFQLFSMSRACLHGKLVALTSCKPRHP